MPVAVAVTTGPSPFGFLCFFLASAEPGETAIIMGVGGIGINAVQGAAYAGASHVIAVDPNEFKRLARV